MGTINDKLNKLEQTKTNIKNELRRKGADVKDSDTFASYEGYLHDLEILNAQAKTVNPSTSSQTVIPDSEYNALSQVTVNAIQTETKNVKSATTSQIVTPSAGKFINEITVEPIELESKVVTPTTSQQVITPSQDKDGIGQVTVNAVPDETSVLNEQDSLLSTQDIKISDLEEALNNKIALDLTNATADANATANDIMEGKTAYVNGQKIEGTNQGNIPNWSEIGYSDTPQPLLDNFAYSKNIYDNWDSSITNMSQKYQGNTNLVYFPVVDTSRVTNMYYCFGFNSNLEIIKYLDISNVTNTDYLATSCSNLLEVNLSFTSKITSMQYMFSNCNKLREIPLFDTSNVTNMQGAFLLCNSITTIPLFDTSKVTNMSSAFARCANLTTIPLLNTSKVTNFENIFIQSSNLSNESLNNILQMCINATSYRGTKTLSKLGLSSTQATICQTLSNWNDFVSAGWTTGY